MRNRNSGVTLIELMMVMVIVGILTAVAIPGYRQYMMRTNRTDAKTALMSMAGALERCYTTFSSYDPADGCAAVTDMDTPGNPPQYSITGVVTRTTFVLTAAPLGGQVGDTRCGSFILDQAARRTVSSSADAGVAADCWGR